MPRTAAKSKTVHKTPPPVQEEEVEYITPDLTEDQWPDILEAHEVVGEIMEDLTSNVMKGCSKVDIDRQLIPYTTSWVKSFIIQTLEQQIFYPNEGPEELSKTEDSEPTPTAPDAWAQGCVPVVKASHRPHSTSRKLSEADMGQIHVQTELRVSEPCNGETQTKNSSEQSKKEGSPTNPASGKHCKVLSPCPPPPKIEVKRKQQVNLPPKPIPGKVLPPLPCLTDKKDVGVDRKLIRQKNCQPIPKLDPLCLPQHCVFPRYEIVDSSPKLNSKKKPSVLPRLQPRNNNQHTDYTVTPPKPLTSSKDHLRRFQASYDDDCVKKVYHPRQTRRLPSPDTMLFSKDVFLDIQTVEMNPVILDNPYQSTNLMPIRSNPAVPLYSVNQVTTGPPPKVTPLFPSKSHDL